LLDFLPHGFYIIGAVGGWFFSILVPFYFLFSFLQFLDDFIDYECFLYVPSFFILFYFFSFRLSIFNCLKMKILRIILIFHVFSILFKEYLILYVFFSAPRTLCLHSVFILLSGSWFGHFDLLFLLICSPQINKYFL